MQTGQTLSERVRMLEAGCAVKDAAIRDLHAEVSSLKSYADEVQAIARRQMDRAEAAEAENRRLCEENARLRAVIASPNGHHPDCGYQLDQYTSECNCERSSDKANCPAE